ncbi:PKD domain-containing protein [Kitasatospora sp. NPDC048365]|uniref:right-handed parallel beta-helix repeat-containing protein n=1 Tax=Kitasatospora sp. NPDC048365 TaxID=3364050 RepID=UPI0037152BF5
MRFRQSAVLVVAAATGIVTVPAVSAAGAVPTVLFVNKTAGCSDTGSGTEATPFCSISAAAAVVLPGQTVQVAMGDDEYEESVHVTHSGTAEQPITFVGRPGNAPDASQPWVRSASGTESAFVLDGVHDVVVRGFQLVAGSDVEGGTPAVQVTDSQRVSVDGTTFQGLGGVAVTGTSDHVTVSRNYFKTSGGVRLGAGVRDSLITTNEFFGTQSTAVSTLDAPNTAVTNNTIAFSCGESVKIDGASTGALVENNLITAGYTPADVYTNCEAQPIGRGETEISVSAASATGSKVDYNSVHPWSDANAYTWAGTSYRTAAAFAAAQPGQAANDIDVDFTCQTAGCGGMPPYYRAAVAHPALADSADPDAPGVGTDLRGLTYADNPGATNGPKGGVRDRGAFEATGQREVELSVTGTSSPGTRGTTPFTVTATVTPKSDWPIQQADYAVDFGDGSAPVHSTSPTVSHTYLTAGTFYPTVVITDRNGGRAFGAGTVIRTAATELAANPEITVTPSLYATIVPNASTPWSFTSEEIDFGDGTHQSQTYPQGTYYHQYMVPGDYQLTLTHRDDSGKVLVTKRTVHALSPRDAAALQPGKRVQLLARSANDWLSDAGANYDKGVWGPFLPVPTTGAAFATKDVTAMASTATSDQYLRAFALAGGKVYSADRNLGPAAGGVAQGQWLPWKEVTGANGAGSLSGITQIATASTGNRIHVLALAGGRVYEASGDRASGTWSKWGDITAALGFPANTTSVSAAFIGNVLHVAMLGSDGHIRVGDGDYNRGRWSGGDMTAAIGFAWPNDLMHPTQVAVGATPDGKLHIFTMALGKLLESGGDYVAGRWSPWADVTAATGLSTPNHTLAVAPNGMTLRVFAMDAYGNISEVDGDYAAGRWSKSAYVNTPTGAGILSGTTVITAAGL